MSKMQIIIIGIVGIVIFLITWYFQPNLIGTKETLNKNLSNVNNPVLPTNCPEGFVCLTKDTFAKLRSKVQGK